MESIEPLADRVKRGLGGANPGALARIDQLAVTWRNYFLEYDLNLADETTTEATLRALTMTYGMMLAAKSGGRVDPNSFAVFADIIAAGTAAIVVARSFSASMCGIASRAAAPCLLSN